jgi:hypothetical protein
MPDDVMRGIDFIRLTPTMGAYVRTAMRPQLFPICTSDLLDEILLVQLAEKVFSCLRGEAAPTPLKEIYAITNEMNQTLKLAQAHSYGAAWKALVQGLKRDHPAAAQIAVCRPYRAARTAAGNDFAFQRLYG